MAQSSVNAAELDRINHQINVLTGQVEHAGMARYDPTTSPEERSNCVAEILRAINEIITLYETALRIAYIVPQIQYYTARVDYWRRQRAVEHAIRNLRVFTERLE